MLPAQWTGTRSITRTQIRALATSAAPADALPLYSAATTSNREGAANPSGQLKKKGAVSATAGAE